MAIIPAINISLSEMYGWISVALLPVCYAPYLWSVLRGQIKPHAFSWLTWGTLDIVMYYAQAAGGAGPGSWTMRFASIGCLAIGIVALFKGEKNITRSDWISFTGSLLAIALWWSTKEPLGAVIVLVLVDLLGFYPTYRKSWHRPFEESFRPYILFAVICVFTILAIQSYNWTTLLHPAAMIISNVSFVIMLFWRRFESARANG